MIEPEWTNDVTVSDKEELRDTVEFFREVVQAVRGKLARGGREIPGYLMLNPDFQTLEIPRLVVRAHLMKRVIRMPNRNPEAQREGESPLPGEDLLPVLRGLLRSNDFEHLRRCGIPLSIVANLRRERRRQIWRMTRIVRAGWHVASHSVAASCRALAGPIPTSFASSTGEDLKSPKACRFHLLSHLLDGADIAALKRVGGTRSARQQRRVNSRLYSDILPKNGRSRRQSPRNEGFQRAWQLEEVRRTVCADASPACIAAIPLVCARAIPGPHPRWTVDHSARPRCNARNVRLTLSASK